MLIGPRFKVVFLEAQGGRRSEVSGRYKFEGFDRVTGNGELCGSFSIQSFLGNLLRDPMTSMVLKLRTSWGPRKEMRYQRIVVAGLWTCLETEPYIPLSSLKKK
jgi:hypothetical protein